MDEQVVNNDKTLNGKAFIKTLAIFAFIFAFVSFISTFLQFDYYGSSGNEYQNLGWHFVFPNFSHLIVNLLAFSPYVAFLVYIFVFHKKEKASILIPIVFGIEFKGI